MGNQLYLASASSKYMLDHGYFEDVLKTKYVKGTVSQFSCVDDDEPMSIEKSIIKVSVGAEETDWLPLFYMPLSGYWNIIDQPSAAEWNSAGGYYENAYLSYRIGDEVVVEQEYSNGGYSSKRVMGFYSGAPRLGENAFKVQVSNSWEPTWCDSPSGFRYYVMYPTHAWNGEPELEDYPQPADFDKGEGDCWGMNIEEWGPFSSIALSTICNDDGSNYKYYYYPNVMSGYATSWLGIGEFGWLMQQLSAGDDPLCGTYTGTVWENGAVYYRARVWWNYDFHVHYWNVGPGMFGFGWFTAYWTCNPDEDVTFWKTLWYRNWEDVFIGDEYPEGVPCVTYGCDDRSYSENWYDWSWPLSNGYFMSSNPVNPNTEYTDCIGWDSMEDITDEMAASMTFYCSYCESASPYTVDLSDWWPVTSTGQFSNWYADRQYDFGRGIDSEWFHYVQPEVFDFHDKGNFQGWMYTPERWASATTSATLFDMNLYFFSADYYANWTWYQDEPSTGKWNFIPPHHDNPTSTEE